MVDVREIPTTFTLNLPARFFACNKTEALHKTLITSLLKKLINIIQQNDLIKCGRKSVTCLKLQGLVVLPFPAGILAQIARNA